MVFLTGDHALNIDITVANASNLTMIGVSSLSIIAKIICDGSVGISFTDMVDFKIYSLTFMSCCRKFGIPQVRNYALLLQSTQYAELVNCSFCENLGTALAVINTNVTLVGNNEFTGNRCELEVCGGGGIGAVNSNLTFIGNTTFLRNSASSYGGGAIYATENTVLHFIGTTSFNDNSVHDGGGGAIYASYNTVSTFNGVNNFINNSVDHSDRGGGAICTLYYTILSFNGTNNFVRNSADNGNDEGGGGAIYASDNVTLSFDGTNSFINNSADYDNGGGGSIYASGNVNISFNGNNNFINNFIDNLAYNSGVGGTILALDNAILSFNGTSNFINNSAHSGGVMHALDTILTLNGTNNFTSNSAGYGDGGAIYISGNTVFSFSGTNTFINNSAPEFGGAICADTKSRLMFKGTIKFTNNGHSRGEIDILNGNTTCGGGVYMGLQSTFSILPNTAVYWEKNHANLGGAIYVVDASPLSYCAASVARHVPKEECFFQIHDQNLSSINSQLVFMNNTADAAGSVLYGSAVDNCKLTGLVSYKSGRVFDLLVHTDGNTNSNISSDPIYIHPCGHTYRSVYPGETFQVSAVAVGQRHGRVPSTVRSSIEQQKSELLGYQYLQSTKNTCTKLNYTVFSLCHSVNIRLYPEGSPCSKLGNKYQTTIYVNLNQTCPPGFSISESTRSCICEPRIAAQYTNQCNITNGLGQIARDSSQHFWVGYDDQSHGVILHPRCPFDYCVTGAVVFPLNNTNIQCAYNRSDLLCGACKNGYSLVLGNSQCKQCTNSYLVLLIPFAVMGVALVFLLLALKMTVATGMLSGLVFYANIVEVNYTIFVPEISTDNLSVFIAWLNLDLGIETCFYNGLDAYSKTWLQFVFPVYIWAIIGLMTFVSRFSCRFASLLGNNPVPVLATLILLSYAKVLRTLIAVIYITYLEYPNNYNRGVWLYDANIDYLSGKHIPLFIVALVVFFFLFLPYTLLLFFGQWLQAISHMRLFSWANSARLKPFMDSYHAPYKAKHRYWPGMLLVFRFVLFLVFALNPSQDPSINLLAILVGTGILVVWAWVSGGVYRNWCLDALEGSFALNLIILAATTYHVEHTGGNKLAVGYTSVSIALVTFIGILAYHTFIQLTHTKLLKKAKLNFWYNRQDVKQPGNDLNKPVGNSMVEEDFDQLRESLLDDQPLPSYGAF